MKNITKKLFCLTVALLLVITLPLSAGAMTPAPQLCEDHGRAISSSEEVSLNTRLSQLGERLQMTVAIYTVASLNGHAIEALAQDYLDYVSVRYTDGVIMLIAMEEREWYIYTTGDAYDYLTDAALDDIEETMVPLLSEGDYFEAFRAYAELCDKYLTMGQEGTPYRGSFPWGQNIVIALIVGAVVGLIVVTVMQSKLKSVRPRREAHEYTRPGSMNVTRSRDLFLYRTVHRRPKPKDTSSGGRSGGGSRSGGRGGSF